MRVVLDTNAFISCIGKASAYRNVFDAFLQKEFVLCVSTEILLEYEELFTKFWSEEVAQNLLGRLLAGTNTSLHSIFYHFNLVAGDADDNKFSDLFISAQADYLVSNDHVLLALNQVAFPSVRVVTLQQFSKLV